MSAWLIILIIIVLLIQVTMQVVVMFQIFIFYSFSLFQPAKIIQTERKNKNMFANNSIFSSHFPKNVKNEGDISWFGKLLVNLSRFNNSNRLCFFLND